MIELSSSLLVGPDTSPGMCQKATCNTILCLEMIQVILIWLSIS